MAWGVGVHPKIGECGTSWSPALMAVESASHAGWMSHAPPTTGGTNACNNVIEHIDKLT